jgi:hypothetical protein
MFLCALGAKAQQFHNRMLGPEACRFFRRPQTLHDGLILYLAHFTAIRTDQKLTGVRVLRM